MINKLRKTIKKDIWHDLVYRYTVCVAWMKLGENKKAIKLIPEIVKDYCKLLGIKPEEIVGRNSDDLWEMISISNETNEDLKHLGDSLEVSAILENKFNRFSIFRVQALEFYNLCGAYASSIRVGQDLVDEFLDRRDFIGAKMIMVESVIPVAKQGNMLDKMISIKSHYAVVLAYCKEFNESDAEFKKLEIEHQKKLVTELKLHSLVTPFNA
ncbi:MAG: hypothetical protein ACJAXJ_001212 [Colwellia sp.]